MLLRVDGDDDGGGGGGGDGGGQAVAVTAVTSNFSTRLRPALRRGTKAGHSTVYVTSSIFMSILNVNDDSPFCDGQCVIAPFDVHEKKTKFYSFLSRVPEGFITLISSFIGRYDKNGGIQISNIITCNFTIDYQSEEIL